MTVKRIYKVVVEYPTPDGKPFFQQSAEVRDGIIAAALHHLDPAGGYGEKVPAWLRDVDLGPWLWARGSGLLGSPRVGPLFRGHTICYEGNPLVDVPRLRRVFFFRRSAAESHANRMILWDCDVNVLRSKPFEWENEEEVG